MPTRKRRRFSYQLKSFYAKTLGPSLADLLNNPIPDYDPTSELRISPSQSGLMHQVSASGWPTEHDTVRNPQEEERDGEPRISLTGAADLARAHAAFLDWKRQYQKERYWQRRLHLICSAREKSASQATCVRGCNGKDRPTRQGLAEPAG